MGVGVLGGLNDVVGFFVIEIKLEENDLVDVVLFDDVGEVVYVVEVGEIID